MAKYPSSIIPDERHRLELDIDSLLRNYELVIVRRTDVPLGTLWNRMKNLNPMAVTPKDIPDMSMNLLGGNYVIPYLKFRTDKKASAEWRGSAKASVKTFSKNIFELTNYSALFIPVKTLHKIQVPFQAPNETQYKRSYPNYPFEPNNATKTLLEYGTAEIKHDPTILNYWHVVLVVKSFYKGEPVKSAKSRFNNFACESIINNVISAKATEKPIGSYKIAKEFYYS